MSKSKAPAFQFYPGDWARDLEEHPLEIEGAWIRICCKLWWEEERGTATKTLENWARILREKSKKTFEIICYLDKHRIADVDNQNGTITISSRRMVHDENIRNIRKLAGSKGGNPALKNKLEKDVFAYPNEINQIPTPSSSSSLKHIPPISPRGKVSDEPMAFKAFWSEYPRRTARPAALKAWIKHVTEEHVESVMSGARRYAKECIGKDPQFIAHPATWLNNHRWEDEPVTPITGDVTNKGLTAEQRKELID